jgi:hypothetical protein
MGKNALEAAVREYLRRREVGPHVLEGGLEYLVESWDRTASQVAGRETWMWEEWVNDLDGREIIECVLEGVPEAASYRSRVGSIDDRFRASAVATEERAWGDEIAERERWDRSRSWWYWTKPPTPFEP